MGRMGRLVAGFFRVSWLLGAGCQTTTKIGVDSFKIVRSLVLHRGKVGGWDVRVQGAYTSTREQF